jgi:hypothetical protein
MSIAVALQELEEVQEPPIFKQFDEADWPVWPAEHPPTRPGRSAVITAVKWASIVGLVALGGLWSRYTPFEVEARFIVAAGAIFVMARSLLARRYAVVVVCGALFLLYNPLAPLFDLSGNWQRAVFVATAAPFLASLIWGDVWRRFRT